MARPSVLLRADTLDLQDHDSPSAAEHAAPNPLQPNGLAPHLSAQVHQVMEERHSEEQSLADAWNIADSLTENPGAIDQAQAKNAKQNGANGSGEGDADGADQDDGDDDDMMDRISSSPSIDDGGYTLHSATLPTLRTIWPVRSSSVSPNATLTPTRETFNQSALSSPGSSPFTQTPQHLPIRARMVEIQRPPLAWRTALLPTTATSDTSPFTASQHHPKGRYGQEPETGAIVEDSSDGENDAAIFEDEYSEHSTQEHVSDTSGAWPPQRRRSDLYNNPRPIESPFRHHVFAHGMADLDQTILQHSTSLNSIVSVDLETLLLPADDSLLEAPCSPNGSTGSWESLTGSESDALKEEDMDDDDADDAFLNLDARFIDSGWGGECLREVEDIDFEFVYALHTFVATVEGQANATKGDTMVLLDDSNSYWWLVRVVKDSSIGYLPAEHIETPTERLARLNKHRNIDLSATMLSDNSEKSRNPLKKAMRRRNTKTVQFAAPTYVEASDYDYSSSEDEDNMIDPYASALQSDNGAQAVHEAELEEPKAEVKDTAAEGRSSTSSNRASFDREQAATAARALAAAGVGGDDEPVSPKLVDKTGEFERADPDNDSIPTNSVEAAPLKSRKTRNTDSFLRDDTIETRKITLTPGILRDESGSLKSPTSISEEPKRSNSLTLEPLTKVSTPPEQPKKEGKEKKESKKGGLLSGLFKSKKKEKKSKDDGNDVDSEKLSMELSRESPRASPLTSEATSPVDNKYINGMQFPAAGKGYTERTVSGENARDASADASGGFLAELPGSEVAHEMATGQEDDIGDSQRRADLEVESTPPEKPSSLSSALSPLANVLKSGEKEPKPKKAKRAKQRVELDDFDSPPEEVTQNPFEDKEAGDRLSESPVEISSNTFMHGTESIHIPMPESGDEDDNEPGSLTSSPSLIDHPSEPLEVDEMIEDNDPTPTALSPQPQISPQHTAEEPGQTALSSIDTSTSRNSPRASPAISQQSWSDKGLRAWLEDGTEVRDMLVMINDKTGVKPAPADHPLMSGLFVEERKGVTDMMGQLDNLLGAYLQRKGVQY